MIHRGSFQPLLFYDSVICQPLGIAYSDQVSVTVAMYLLRGSLILTQQWLDFSLRNSEVASPFHVRLLVRSQLQEHGCHPW